MVDRSRYPGTFLNSAACKQNVYKQTPSSEVGTKIYVLSGILIKRSTLALHTFDLLVRVSFFKLLDQNFRVLRHHVSAECRAWNLQMCGHTCTRNVSPHQQRIDFLIERLEIFLQISDIRIVHLRPRKRNWKLKSNVWAVSSSRTAVVSPHTDQILHQSICCKQDIRSIYKSLHSCMQNAQASKLALITWQRFHPDKTALPVDVTSSSSVLTRQIEPHIKLLIAFSSIGCFFDFFRFVLVFFLVKERLRLRLRAM